MTGDVSDSWLHAPTLLMELGMAGDIRALNMRWQARFGWVRQEVVGTALGSLIAEPDLEALYDALARLPRESEVQFRARLRSQFDTLHPMHWTLSWAQNKVHVHAYEDTTGEAPHRFAAESFRHIERDTGLLPEEFMGLIASSRTEVFTLLHPDMTIRYCSPGLTPRTGYLPEELIGRVALDLIHPEDQARLSSALQRSIQGQILTGAPFEYRQRTKDGRWIRVRTTAVMLLREEQLHAIALVSRDVTEEYEATRRLERRVRELETRATPTEEDFEQLEEVTSESVAEVTGEHTPSPPPTRSEEAVPIPRRLTLGLNHELRTPLSTLLGYAELLLEGVVHGAARPRLMEDISRVQHSSRMLLCLLNDVYFLEALRQGRGTIYLERVDASAIVEEVARAWGVPGDEIRTSVDPSIEGVYTDPSKWRQLLINMLWMASSEEGVRRVLRVSAAVGGDGFLTESVIHGWEDGADVLWQQLRGPWPSGKRITMLLLASTWHLANTLGGRMTLEDASGGGVRLQVMIPARIARREVSYTSAPNWTPPELLSSQITALATVLVIDDDPSIHKLMRRMLESEPYRVISASNGSDGLELAKRKRPDVIVLDVVMPTLDGWSVLTRLKAQPELKDIPVLIQSIVHDRELGQSLGASDFLPKPLAREPLLAALERWTSGRRGGAPWAWIAVGPEHAGVEEALTLLGFQVHRLGGAPPPLGHEVELLIVEAWQLQEPAGRMLMSLREQLAPPGRIWCVRRDQGEEITQTWPDAWIPSVEYVSWDVIMRRLRPRGTGGDGSVREP